jgi:mRNA interferase YafQ
MLSLVVENQFKKDVKRLQKRGKNIEKLKIVIEKLLNNQKLDPKYQDHALTGNWKNYRDCHIEPDWVLIYKISDNYLFLVRSGSHSDLFS